ncbi:phage late control D family protein [Desulfurivibrio sp. D14AmB]|uniref:phage late control D family protein n=1 Tax=Desulfurivibrio sp. D14AmB TaxID=3374370 RepID=UPI00376ED817
MSGPAAPAVYNPRPVVRIDGRSSERLGELLQAMEMREEEGGLTSLELRFSNIASDPDGGADYAFEDEAEISLGAAISVAAGDAAAPREIFRGLITALEADFPGDGPPELVVLAEDRLQLARMSRRTAIYREMSLVDLVGQIAGRCNLQPRVSGLTEHRESWVQFNESDLAFLRRLLRRFDADLQVVEERLEVAPVSEIQREVIELALFHELRRVRFIADLAHQVTEVTSSGWDPLRGRSVSGSSRGLNFGPGRGRRGGDLLAQTLGRRREHVGQVAVLTDQEAQALADTVFDRRARRFVCAEGTAEGHPGLRVGSHLRLTGVSRRFQNTYQVVRTLHRFDLREGYFTDFKAESATLGEAV